MGRCKSHYPSSFFYEYEHHASFCAKFCGLNGHLKIFHEYVAIYSLAVSGESYIRQFLSIIIHIREQFA